MADALLSATVDVLLKKAISLATERIDLVFGFQEKLESLRESAAMIQAVLADAEEKQGQIQAIKLWLKRLEGVAFEVDYVLDELNYENLRRKVELQNQEVKGKVCFFSFSCIDFTFRWIMASRIRDINTKLERINQKANDFGLRIMHQNEASLPAVTGATSSRQTDSILAQNVVGRAVDESRLVEMLLSSSEEIVSVVAITGMSGLGKTTLAKIVYNNSRIDGHFGKKVWVCLSKEIGIVELFKLILESLTREKFELDLRDAIVQRLRQHLAGKRYLLVLDDVWNNDQGLWDDFFTTMEGLNTANGSWCLVTTRLEQVAYSLSGHFLTNADPYFLGKLSDDNCWSIVKEKVIAGVEEPEDLKAIRNEIIKRCNGLPLAASVIGGLLRTKRKDEWLTIVEKNLLSGDQTGVEQILKVSFDYLSPVSVKKCFAYCAIFPKDTLLERDLLIELWMAEGYLMPAFGNEILMEKIGDKYFEILLQSSLLEEVKGDSATYYKMHDLVHGFAESILKPESSNQVCYHAESIERMTESTIKDRSASLRTLFLESRISGDVLMKFKNLHVLKLFGSDFMVLPTSIGKLIHLRFLDLSNSRINSLPDSVCKLYNLQTLRVKEYQIRAGFPKHMCNLISLRHLHCYVGNADFKMPENMGLLTGLQTLKFFNIGQEKGHQLTELGCLKDLKGSLEIRHLELVKGKEEAKLARLLEKTNLVELKFEWCSVIREGDNCDSDVLEGIQPHPNLQKLVIQNFMGDHFPQWLVNLSSLVKLRLTDCKTCTELPALGQLPSLQDLELDGLENVTCLGLSFYSIDGGRLSRSTSSFDCQVIMPAKLFPALKALSLRNMGSLAEWEEVEVRLSAAGETLDVFPMLERVFIYKCSHLVSAPSQFPSLEKLEIKDNCNISLLRKIQSSLIGVSSIELYGGMAELYDEQHIESLHLVRHRNLVNSHQGTSLILTGCGSLSSEMVEALCHFPSLQNLTLHHCPNLTRISGCGTSVEHLELWNCDNLSELPRDLGNFCSLYNLEIKECPSIVFPEGGYNLTSLRHLTINCCNGLISLPSGLLQSCTSLQQLKVYDCPDLVSFPLDLQQTPSLSWIAIYTCPKLVTMPKGFGFLTSLKELWMGPFLDENFLSNEFDWPGLISSSTLEEVELYGLPHENSLPHQLQYLTNLKHLYLYDFGELEALPDWIGNLTSLECLYIKHCKKLQYLPSMPAMRRLTKLRSLYINGSPLLKERCNSDSSPESEWSKISLIPNHWIGHSLSL